MAAAFSPIMIVGAWVQAFSAAGMIEAELAPGAIANEQAAIEEDIRARAATYFHPSGTCRMGSDTTAVVDPQLRVIGL